MNFVVKNKKELALIVGLILLFMLVYMLILLYGGPTDFSAHVRIAKEKLITNSFLEGNFLFYLLVNFFSAFTGNRTLMKIALVLLLAMATTGKFIIANKDLTRLGISYNLLWSFSLLFVYIIPLLSTWTGTWYWCGYMVPTVWHNSTTIFLFPFALALFLLAQKQLESYNQKRNVYIVLLVLLNIWIKPSYFFVFVCVYPLFLLLRYGFKDKNFYFALLPVIIGGFFLVGEYVSIYLFDTYNTQDDSSVIVSFSNITSLLWLLNKLKYAFISLLFPFLYTVLHYRQVAKDRTFWFVWLQVFVAVLIYWLCYETGERATHGNFYWQIVVCVWILFFYTLRSLLISIKQSTSILYKRMDYALLSFYGIHVLFGLLYLIRMFLIKTYI